ncbi:MAG: FAD-binding protein [Patescibacteria group bacterium]|nr:FAD-binding protein [Patescibacteria group bacterium]
MKSLKSKLEQDNIFIKTNEPMSKHTSLRVGGPAEYFAEANTFEDLVLLYKYAREENSPIFILGSGTNILVGDRGICGLVIKNNVFKIEILGKVPFSFKKAAVSRRQETHWRKGFLSSADLRYEEDVKEGVLVEVFSGTPLAFLINQTLKKGITGLSWFSGIPGTVGGAVWNNIHGGDLFFGDFLKTVSFVDKGIVPQELSSEELNLKYNSSYFKNSSKIILSAKLVLPLGDKRKAREVSEEWIKRKSAQPQNSAGCTFNNLSDSEAKRLNLENCGAGFIIDKILNLRSLKVGGAQISDRHANFIVTDGTANASDVVKIIETVQARCMEKLGIKLKEEIVRVGEF